MSAQVETAPGMLATLRVMSQSPDGDKGPQADLRRRTGVIAAVALAHVGLAALLMAPRWVVIESKSPPITVTLMERQLPPEPKPLPPAMGVPVVSAIMIPVPDIKVASESPLQVVAMPVDKTTPAEDSVNVANSSSFRAVPPVVNESDVDYLYRPPVEYPIASKRLKEQGMVLLLVLIDEYGRVAQLEIVHSAGSPRLDQSAIRALKHARFRPYRQNGVAIPVQVRVPVEFSIRSVA